VAAAGYGRVYDKSGNGTSTVTVDGVAAGVWELGPDAGTVTVAPFGEALARRWDGLDAQVAGLARAIGTDLRLARAAASGLLSDGARNAYLSPVRLGKG
jgi:hypothetical protein